MMKHKRIAKVKGNHGRKNWSEWINPKPRGYLMSCCDCGLVHEMDFNAIEIIGPGKRRGYYQYRVVPKLQVTFRARRAEGYTRRERAKRAKS